MGPARQVFTSVLVLLLSFQLSMCCTFTMYNSCPHTIWPGTLAGAGTPQLPTTGFRLEPGRSVRIAAPPGWSGRMWARTGCEFDAEGAGTCQTGDCGGRIECGGAGALPPATLFEITLGKGKDLDYYDVSLVDGYNAPVSVVPTGGNGSCRPVTCESDLNRSCPGPLRVERDGDVVACKSACLAFGTPVYCCTGEFASPEACKPTAYSRVFKKACPTAYSYAYDDPTSIFMCKGADYLITFC